MRYCEEATPPWRLADAASALLDGTGEAAEKASFGRLLAVTEWR